MRRKLCCVTVLVLGLSASGALAASGDSKDAPHESTSFAVAIMDLVLQKHIDPPTRQAMVLAGTKALYRADDRIAPKGLSSRVSELAKPDQIAEYLDTVFAEFEKLPDPQGIWIRGAVQGVPGGVFLIDAQSSKVRQQLAANRYVGTGIGLTMDKKQKRPAISKVFLNGPAWRAGIKVKDVILEIDGKPTVSRGMNQVVEQLRGEAGSDVTVVVRQPDAEESRTLSVTRGRVFIPTVLGHREISEGKWQYTIDSAPEIAVVRINSIGPSTLHELRQVEATLRQKDVRGIVLDLRSGGGILHDVVMVADGLLDGGMIGHVRSLDSVKTYEASPGALFQDLAMVVLVKKFTNADRVFLTAALQDQGRAIVVGEPTSGQTYVNSIVPVPGRDELVRMAVAVMQRGDGTTLLVPRSGSSPSQLLEVAADERRNLEEVKARKRPGFIMPDHVVVAAGSEQTVVAGSEQAGATMLNKAIEVLRAETEGQDAPKKEVVSGS